MLTGVYVSTSDLIDVGSQSSPRRKRRLGIGGHAGNLSSRSRGRGVDLDEVRLYQAGDDARNIDWKVTARKQKTHTKIFKEEKERPTFLIVDQSASMFFGSQVRMKAVAAAESAARIGWVTLQARDRIGGLVTGCQKTSFFKPIRTKLNLVRLLDAISIQNNQLNRDQVQQASTSETWQEILWNVRRIAPVGHQMTFISDFQNLQDTQLNQLLALQHHNQVTLLLIYDPLESELPPASTYHVTDGRNRISFATNKSAIRKEYQEAFQHRVDHLRQQCHQRGVRLVTQSTSEETPEVLLHA